MVGTDPFLLSFFSSYCVCWSFLQRFITDKGMYECLEIVLTQVVVIHTCFSGSSRKTSGSILDLSQRSDSFLRRELVCLIVNRFSYNAFMTSSVIQSGICSLYWNSDRMTPVDTSGHPVVLFLLSSKRPWRRLRLTLIHRWYEGHQFLDVPDYPVKESVCRFSPLFQGLPSFDTFPFLSIIQSALVFSKGVFIFLIKEECVATLKTFPVISPIQFPCCYFFCVIFKWDVPHIDVLSVDTFDTSWTALR